MRDNKTICMIGCSCECTKEFYSVGWIYFSNNKCLSCI